MNAASAASVALAPPAPRVTTNGGSATIGRGTSGYDASLQWQPSAGAVAYRVYWREAWTNDWQKSQVVGNVTKMLLPNVSIDDYVFGVAAIGADGNESVVSAYVSPVRKMTDVLIKK